MAVKILSKHRIDESGKGAILVAVRNVNNSRDSIAGNVAGQVQKNKESFFLPNGYS
jgi:hypothetical protein